MLHPVLFQIDVEPFLRAIVTENKSNNLTPPPLPTLADIPDTYLDDLASSFDYVYLVGVWQTSSVALAHSRAKPDLAHLDDASLRASPFAIAAYEPRIEYIGGVTGLTAFRKRLNERGVLLMVDFVPNHVAKDHKWTIDEPDLLMQGTPELLAAEPQNYFEVKGFPGRVLAYGRDPFFDGWGDTVQLNYASAALRKRMQEVLENICETIADGVRCDMAMLVLDSVFQTTWGKVLSDGDGGGGQQEKDGLGEFWAGAIAAVKKINPDFVFMAEAYWDKEYDLQQQGFDWCYDKRLYDRIQEEHGSDTQNEGSSTTAERILDHLYKGNDTTFQQKLVRFMENHDEHRAASVFGQIQAPSSSSGWQNKHAACATLTFTSAGLRFFFEGQRHGMKVFNSMHRSLREVESPLRHPLTLAFYSGLLNAIRSCPELLDDTRVSTRGLIHASQDDDPCYRNIASVVHWCTPTPTQSGLSLTGQGLSTGLDTFVLVVSNLSDRVAHGHLQLPEAQMPDAIKKACRGNDGQKQQALMQDMLPSGPCWVRQADDLLDGRMWVSLAPWESHIFRVRIIAV